MSASEKLFYIHGCEHSMRPIAPLWLLPLLLLLLIVVPVSALKIQLDRDIFHEGENITLTVLTARETVVQLISDRVIFELSIEGSSSVEFPPLPPGTYTVYATDGYSDAVREITVIESLSIEAPDYVYPGEEFSVYFKGSGDVKFTVVSEAGEERIAKEINLDEIRTLKLTLNETGTYRLVLSGSAGEVERSLEVVRPFLEAEYKKGLVEIQSGENRTILILFIGENGERLEKVASNGSVAVPMEGYRAIVADSMGKEIGSVDEFKKIYADLPHVIVEKRGGLPEFMALAISTFVVAIVLAGMVFILRGGR
jgi:hypothetical protein